MYFYFVFSICFILSSNAFYLKLHSETNEKFLFKHVRVVNNSLIHLKVKESIEENENMSNAKRGSIFLENSTADECDKLRCIAKNKCQSGTFYHNSRLCYIHTKSNSA